LATAKPNTTDGSRSPPVDGYGVVVESGASHTFRALGASESPSPTAVVIGRTAAIADELVPALPGLEQTENRPYECEFGITRWADDHRHGFVRKACRPSAIVAFPDRHSAPLQKGCNLTAGLLSWSMCRLPPIQHQAIDIDILLNNGTLLPMSIIDGNGSLEEGPDRWTFLAMANVLRRG
jgi:hypothetical protein